MTKPLDVDTIVGEFSDSDNAWTVIDAVTGARLNVPDPERYSGVEVVRFFLSRSDAEKHIAAVLAASPPLAEAVLVAVPVPLVRTAKAIAARCASGQKVGFVVHPPNEVFEAYGA
jgi:hypothetical protein